MARLLVSRCVPFSTAHRVMASLFCVTWPLHLPTVGRPPFAGFGFRRAKLSAAIPLGKLGMSRWCGVSRVYAWPHSARRGQRWRVAHFPRQAPRSRTFRGRRADPGASQRRPPGHHARFGALGFRTVWSAQQEADGSWQRKELPGPPLFVFWWASLFRVYSITLCQLGTARAHRASLSCRLLG